MHIIRSHANNDSDGLKSGKWFLISINFTILDILYIDDLLGQGLEYQFSAGRHSSQPDTKNESYAHQGWTGHIMPSSSIRRCISCHGYAPHTRTHQHTSYIQYPYCWLWVLPSYHHIPSPCEQRWAGKTGIIVVSITARRFIHIDSDHFITQFDISKNTYSCT